MFLVETLASLFDIKLDPNGRPGYDWRKDLNMSLQKLDWRKVKSGLKNFVIANAKNFISI